MKEGKLADGVKMDESLVGKKVVGGLSEFVIVEATDMDTAQTAAIYASASGSVGGIQSEQEVGGLVRKYAEVKRA